MKRYDHAIATARRVKLERRALLLTLAAAPFGAGAMRIRTEIKTKVEQHQTRAEDGAKIHFATAGEGAPLVLLHGFSDRIESWTEFGYVKALTGIGARVIMIDQRGHGRTDMLHDIDAYAPHLRAGDVAAVLDALKIEQADILGYSMGGWAALNMARFHAGRVRRLIVGGCHPFGQNMGFYREAVAGDIEKWIAFVDKVGGPLSDAWKARVRGNDVIALRAAVAEDRPDISKALSGFDRPALFYCGSEDPLRPAVARCAEFFPQGRFAEVKGCNHMSAFTRADLVTPHLQAFLSEA